MLRDFALKFPHWLFYEITASAYIMFRMILTEDMKVKKLAAILRGTWDGLLGRLGVPYWAEIESISQSNGSGN